MVDKQNVIAKLGLRQTSQKGMWNAKAQILSWNQFPDWIMLFDAEQQQSNLQALFVRWSTFSTNVCMPGFLRRNLCCGHRSLGGPLSLRWKPMCLPGCMLLSALLLFISALRQLPSENLLFSSLRRHTTKPPTDLPGNRSFADVVWCEAKEVLK